MTRNLEHRIEILTPVEDPRVQAQLAAAFDVLLADDTAWMLQPDGCWKRLRPKKAAATSGSQDALMRKARARSRRRSARRAR
jgi:polyphosphate kinase